VTHHPLFVCVYNICMGMQRPRETQMVFGLQTFKSLSEKGTHTYDFVGNQCFLASSWEFVFSNQLFKLM
jgi:hypothetical protein